MEFVGDILKKTREGKKISISNVSKELRISEETLSNLENNYLPKDIDRVFIIGHLRSYCSLLNLNHDEIIELYKLQHFPLEKKNIEIEKPKFEFKINVGLYLFKKSQNNKIILFLSGVLLFSFISIQECKINPTSNECLEISVDESIDLISFEDIAYASSTASPRITGEIGKMTVPFLAGGPINDEETFNLFGSIENLDIFLILLYIYI